MTPTYLDYNASAPARAAALEAFAHAAAHAGNAASAHRCGRAARRILEDARESLAACLGTPAASVVFTSGGTESNNLAIAGVAAAAAARRADVHVVTSAIEHPSVLEPCRALAARGVRVTRVPVEPDGRVDPARVAGAIRANTALVSVMWVNNETGVIQPVEEIAARARERGVPFHSDAVQAFGRVPLDAARAGVDLLSVSGHKFGAPAGVGALVVAGGVDLAAVAHGGGQENGRRSGSPAVALAAALAAAAQAAHAEQEAEALRLRALRDGLEQSLIARIPDAVINAATAPRVANTSSVRLPGADGEAVLLALDALGIAVSSAAACAAARRATSHVLTAMGLSRREADDSLRVSLGYRTTPADVDNLVAALPEVVARIRAATRPARAL